MPHGNDRPIFKTPTFGNKQTNLDNAPEQEPVRVQVPETPEPKHEQAATNTAKPARKSKPSTKSLRTKDKGERTERLSFEVTKDEKWDINMAKMKLNTAVTHFTREAVLGFIRNGYVCAACGARFTILEEEGYTVKPNVCPCCQSEKFSRIVRI